MQSNAQLNHSVILEDASQMAGSVYGGYNLKAPMINYKHMNFPARKDYLKFGLDHQDANDKHTMFSYLKKDP